AGIRPVRLGRALAIARPAARTLGAGRGIAASGTVTVRRRASGAMLLMRGSGIALPRRAAIFPGKGHADQLFDIAEIAHLLGAGNQRDRCAIGAGARGAADAMDISLGNVRKIEVDDVAD